MDTLMITVIGNDIRDLVLDIIAKNTVKTVNTVSTGRLGNLTSVTYGIDLEPKEVVETRKKLMEAMAKEHTYLQPMYVYGDWMKIFVIKKFAIKTRC